MAKHRRPIRRVYQGANRAVDSGECGSFVKHQEGHMPISKPWDGVGTKPGYDRGFYYTSNGDTPVREHNLVSVAKGLSTAVEKGAVTGEGFAKSQIELASQMYRNEPTPYHALAKLLGTNLGKAMTAEAAQANYERLQRGSALGDGYEAVLKMNERDSGDGTTPHVHRAGSSAPVGSDDDGDNDETPEQAMAALLADAQKYKMDHPDKTEAQCFDIVRNATPLNRRRFARTKHADVMKNASV
jgi:hypothetical protein